jgi:glycosyltransferase involved in cell wall biosynthesis
VADGVAVSPLDAGWRAQAARAQEEVLPGGRVVVSSRAPLGVGGLGRHLQEIMDALARRQLPAVCVSGEPAATRIDRFTLLKAVRPLIRFSPAARVRVGSARFDQRAAMQLPEADHLIAFNGTALAQFRAARRADYSSLSLVSANSHLRQLVERHERAYRQYPVERPWATHIVRRNLREYAQADRIYVASRYIWESFVERGFPEERLACFPLTPDPRYRPERPRPSSTSFDVVYVGSLVVHKGVPLLLDAFSRLAHEDLRLVLVGGWKTRSMRRFIEAACARDRRILVRPGDPLAHLLGAGVCVHPAYEDGFGYAPAEALACGVPLLVSEDTGMKELIADERHGLILPTGEVGALAEAIDAAYRGETPGG